jgi:hypothetical protein
MTTTRKSNRLALGTFVVLVGVAALLPILLPRRGHAQPAPAAKSAGPGQLDAYIDLLRSDIRADKDDVLKANLELSDKESQAFWPVYRQYEDDLRKLNDQRVALIKDYAENYDSLSNEKAKELTTRALDLEEKRAALKKQYLAKFETALPGKALARFYQIESRLNMLIDLQLAANLPIAKK